MLYIGLNVTYALDYVKLLRTKDILKTLKQQIL